jgi:hypothetical protein
MDGDARALLFSSVSMNLPAQRQFKSQRLGLVLSPMTVGRIAAGDLRLRCPPGVFPQGQFPGPIMHEAHPL